jgi:hypothetical protein
MHKAGEYPSTWVPIAKANWFWHFVYWKGADGTGGYTEKDWTTTPYDDTNELPIWNGYIELPNEP